MVLIPIVTARENHGGYFGLRTSGATRIERAIISETKKSLHGSVSAGAEAPAFCLTGVARLKPYPSTTPSELGGAAKPCLPFHKTLGTQWRG